MGTTSTACRYAPTARLVPRGLPLLLGAVLALVVGCRSGGEPPSGEHEGDPYLRCAQPHDDGAVEQIKLPPMQVAINGHTAEVSGIKRGLVVLGLLAGISDPVPETLTNVKLFLSRFREAGVQAVVVVGGLGLTREQLDGSLAALAAAPVPILLTPGAQESFDLFREAVSAARRTHPQLIDMTRVRRARLGHVTLVSLPGYHKPYYLQARERGCAYEEGDLEETANLFEPERTTVLLSPSPPRGSGPAAVDRGRGGVNIGDRRLAALLARASVSFGLFGHVFESGGNATSRDGRSPLVPGVWQDSLFLQAGAAEALPLTLVGGGRSVGMAQIVEFSGRRGRFRSLAAASGGP